MLDFVVTEFPFNGRTFTAAFSAEGGQVLSLRVESSEGSSRVGCICKGYVDNVVRQIGGAFVRLDDGKPVFLPIKKGAESGIRGSMPIVVQIKKDESGFKHAVATTELSLAGRYVVLFESLGRPCYSSKLAREERELLAKWLEDGELPPQRVLIRTNAPKAGKAALLREIRELSEKMKKLRERAEEAPTGSLLYRPDPFYIEEVRDLRQTPDRFFSDIPVCAEALRAFSEGLEAEDGSRRAAQRPEDILFTRGTKALTLAELYGLPHALDQLTQKRVWLKSGAFLVIEKTEAFVSVDVNSGSCAKSRIPEETFRKVNIEAAQELARQIRLRNLSGMILVDFISMESADHNEELLNVMKKLTRTDTVQTQVIDLTPLGIMEIIRRKERKPLAEELGLC